MEKMPRLYHGQLCYIRQEGCEWSYPCFRIVDTTDLKDPVPFVMVRRVDSQERLCLPAANVIGVPEAPSRSQLRRLYGRRAAADRPGHLSVA